MYKTVCIKPYVSELYEKLKTNVQLYNLWQRKCSAYPSDMPVSSRTLKSGVYLVGLCSCDSYDFAMLLMIVIDLVL